MAMGILYARFDKYEMLVYYLLDIDVTGNISLQRQIANIPELTLLNPTTFPILYSHKTIVNQINVARSKLEYFLSPQLAEEMKSVLDDLEGQSLEATSNGKRLKLGHDYVVTAVKAESS